PVLKREPDFPPEIAPLPTISRRAPVRESRESLIAGDITIEGKIEGAGHVRLAGRFKGDVHIQGDLTVDAGAKLTGSIRANAVARRRRHPASRCRRSVGILRRRLDPE